MNNCVFTTHHTLTKDHATNSLRSLLYNQSEPTEWEYFIIYNTHEDEIPNEWLVDQISKYDVNKQIKNLTIFPYQTGLYERTLTQDIINQLQIIVQNELTDEGKTLLLKSDYCVSRNFNKCLNQQSTINTLWSLPVYSAKETVSREEIETRLALDKFCKVDDITYCVNNTDSQLSQKHITDSSIRFISHDNNDEYNVHVFSNDIVSTCLYICRVSYDIQSSWRGANKLFNTVFTKAGVTNHTDINAFAVHMFHEIVSSNRKEDRIYSHDVILGERY